jgi:hypothetical protein
MFLSLYMYYFFHHCTYIKRPPKGGAFFIRALVTVTLQPINYLLYVDYSAFGRILIYNLHFTPFRIENSKSATSFSLITARKAGVLNEKRCKGAKVSISCTTYSLFFMKIYKLLYGVMKSNNKGISFVETVNNSGSLSKFDSQKWYFSLRIVNPIQNSILILLK